MIILTKLGLSHEGRAIWMVKIGKKGAPETTPRCPSASWIISHICLIYHFGFHQHVGGRGYACQRVGHHCHRNQPYWASGKNFSCLFQENKSLKQPLSYVLQETPSGCNAVSYLDFFLLLDLWFHSTVSHLWILTFHTTTQFCWWQLLFTGNHSTNYF